MCRRRDQPRAARCGGGPPRGYLYRIIAGKSAPTIETYGKLAVPLGADLATRLYPNTGPVIRDRHQARIVEALLAAVHPRWVVSTEVLVWKPARGGIDVVLTDERARLVIATEIQSELRRLEQIVRWSREKAESLPSWLGWPATRRSDRLDGVAEPAPQISQLMVVRRTRATRDVGREFARMLLAAFPAHPADALAALRDTAVWPGSALVWAQLDAKGVRLLATR